MTEINADDVARALGFADMAEVDALTEQIMPGYREAAERVLAERQAMVERLSLLTQTWPTPDATP